MSISTEPLDISQVSLKPPNRIQSMTKFKVVYGLNEDKGILNLNLCEAMVLSVKPSDNNWYLKVAVHKDVMKTIHFLQKKIMELSKEIIPKYIKGIDDDDHIDDMYSSVIQVGKNFKAHLKLRCVQDKDDLFLPLLQSYCNSRKATTCNISVAFLHVRHYKNSLHLICQVTGVQECDDITDVNANIGVDVKQQNNNDESNFLKDQLNLLQNDIDNRIHQIDNSIDDLAIEKSNLLNSFQDLVQCPDMVKINKIRNDLLNVPINKES